MGPCSKIVGSNPCESSQRAAISPPGPAPITATVLVTGELSHAYFQGYVRPYLKLTGTATIEEGGAPKLLSKLAKVVGNPEGWWDRAVEGLIGATAHGSARTPS
jgi:hypothetical protein